MDMLLPTCRSIPTSACCEYGLRYPGCALNSTLSGGTGPVLVMLIPNCVRSAGVMQATLGAVAWGHVTLPCANNVWKIAAEVRLAGNPGTPVKGTKTCGIWRTPLTNPRVFTTSAIWP